MMESNRCLQAVHERSNHHTEQGRRQKIFQGWGNGKKRQKISKNTEK